MADVIDITGTGRRGAKDSHADPDRQMVREGLADPQTGRVKRDVQMRSRSEAAAALRVHGASYAEIAETLEYSSSADARMAVEQVLAATVDETKDYLALRALEGLRLEGLYRAVAPRALDTDDPDQLGFHRAALNVLDRIAKLHGLDAPQRLELVNPGADEFERVLAEMRRASDRGEPEPDLYELEVLDAEWEEADHDAASGLEGPAPGEAGTGAGDEPLDRLPDEPAD